MIHFQGGLELFEQSSDILVQLENIHYLNKYEKPT